MMEAYSHRKLALADWRSRYAEMFRAMAEGDIALTASRGIIYYPIVIGQKLSGSPGIFSHAGVIGQDGFFWNMTARGLSYTWLGNYVKYGGLVAVYRFKNNHLLNLADYQRAIRYVKDMFREETAYDWAGLFTGGWLSMPGRQVCSNLVRAYIIKLRARLDLEDKDTLRMDDPFLMPNEVPAYCDLVHVANADLWRKQWCRQVRLTQSQLSQD